MLRTWPTIGSGARVPPLAKTIEPATRLEIFLAVVALIAAICAISWTVRCLIGRRFEVATGDPNGERQGLLNKEEVVIIDVAAATEARGDDVALCAICKGRLAVAVADGGGQPCGCGLPVCNKRPMDNNISALVSAPDFRSAALFETSRRNRGSTNGCHHYND
uniref:Uncharacterized protein n=1 Tax=Oryza barthii TaxID=65489 RepID=A0A0D3EVN9_9ORYZ